MAKTWRPERRHLAHAKPPRLHRGVEGDRFVVPRVRAASFQQRRLRVCFGSPFTRFLNPVTASKMASTVWKKTVSMTERFNHPHNLQSGSVTGCRAGGTG